MARRFFRRTTTKTGRQLILRPYRWKTDYSCVRAILKGCGMLDPTWDSAESLKLMTQQGSNLILVAEIDGQVAGSVYATTAGYWAFLWRLAVRPALRHQGVGKTLVQSAEEFLRKRGIPEVALFVDTDSEDLHSMYHDFGFQHAGPKYECWWKKLSPTSQHVTERQPTYRRR